VIDFPSRKKPHPFAPKQKLKAVLLLTFLLICAGAIPRTVEAQTLTTLFSFNHTDGFEPLGVLARDSAGNLYGTTASGGTDNVDGVAYKLTPTGSETVLHNFTLGSDGGSPEGGLILGSSGILYGTTSLGAGSAHDYGTVFSLTSSGALTTRFTFTCTATSCPNGANPQSAPVPDTSDNLYGTTYDGTCGTVFKLATNDTLTNLHVFSASAPDGCGPIAGLVRDTAGDLYGTTVYGGMSGGYSGSGTIFKVTAAGVESVLYSFTGGTEGRNPLGTLVEDSSGNLYGTTEYGGSKGFGTVFKLSTANKLTILHTFTGEPDGANPEEGLVRDASGNLYGTTYSGAPTTPAASSRLLRLASRLCFTVSPADPTEATPYSS
jgi:uncharacterized repeat protein (TIGR03803 family)